MRRGGVERGAVARGLSAPRGFSLARGFSPAPWLSSAHPRASVVIAARRRPAILRRGVVAAFLLVDGLILLSRIAALALLNSGPAGFLLLDFSHGRAPAR